MCGILMFVFAIMGAFTQDYRLCIASGLFGIGYGICKFAYHFGRLLDGEEREEGQTSES